MSMTAILLRAFVVAGLPLATGAALAASDATEVYLANVRIDIDIVSAADRMAATRASDERLRRVARANLRRQEEALAALARWRVDEAAPAEVAALPMQSGRSVAIDAPSADALVPPPGVGVLMASASARLDRLAALDGAAFDRSFKATQIAALKSLEGRYESYVRTGGTPALRDMANDQLTEIRAELVAFDGL